MVLYFILHVLVFAVSYLILYGCFSIYCSLPPVTVVCSTYWCHVTWTCLSPVPLGFVRGEPESGSAHPVQEPIASPGIQRAAKCPRGHGSFSFYPLLWVFFLCLLWEPSFFQQPCLPSNIGCEILKRSRPVLLWQCYSKVPIIVERNKSRFSTCFITSALKWTFWTKQISPSGSCMMWL